MEEDAIKEAVKETLKKNYANIVDKLQKNVLLHTALIAFGLGIVAAAFLGLVLYSCFISENPVWFAFGLYGLVVHVMFHMCEFCVAAYVRPREAHPHSFMILHSVHYWVANGLAFIEFFVEALLVPESWKVDPDCFLLGFFFRVSFFRSSLFALGTTVFYGIRILAMLEGKDNFGLAIEEEKREEHVLVNSGIYRYLRHPAYFGWFYRTALAQLIIANPVNFFLHTLVTWYFFKRRIRYEEKLLLEKDYFGEAYEAYKRKTIIGIPFIHT